MMRPIILLISLVWSLMNSLAEIVLWHFTFDMTWELAHFFSRSRQGGKFSATSEKHVSLFLTLELGLHWRLESKNWRLHSSGEGLHRNQHRNYIHPSIQGQQTTNQRKGWSVNVPNLVIADHEQEIVSSSDWYCHRVGICQTMDLNGL
jgi:hypothetical protein